MGWLTTLGTLGGGAVGGPWGAAAGGTIGGAIDGHQEKKAIEKYNAGQAEAGKYSPWTGVKANYNYKQTGALDQAAMGGAKGYLMGGGLSKMMGGVPNIGNKVGAYSAQSSIDNQMGDISGGNLDGVGTSIDTPIMGGSMRPPTWQNMGAGNQGYLQEFKLS